MKSIAATGLGGIGAPTLLASPTEPFVPSSAIEDEEFCTEIHNEQIALGVIRETLTLMYGLPTFRPHEKSRHKAFANLMIKMEVYADFLQRSRKDRQPWRHHRWEFEYFTNAVQIYKGHKLRSMLGVG